MQRKTILLSFFVASLFVISAGDVLGQRKAVSGKEVTGTFKYQFTGKYKGSWNEIQILALGNNKLRVGFSLVYPHTDGSGQPTANVGVALGEAEINGDEAVFTQSEYGTCEIRIKFVRPGVISVTQEQEGGGCGFGLNVSAAGTYKRSSPKKPTFKEMEI
jgi:hypothetical protein